MKYKLENEWFDADDIPELTPEEMQNIMGHVERYDDFKEKLVNDVMKLDRGLEHSPNFKGFGNGSEIGGGV